MEPTSEQIKRFKDDLENISGEPIADLRMYSNDDWVAVTNKCGAYKIYYHWDKMFRFHTNKQCHISMRVEYSDNLKAWTVKHEKRESLSKEQQTKCGQCGVRPNYPMYEKCKPCTFKE